MNIELTTKTGASAPALHAAGPFFVSSDLIGLSISEAFPWDFSPGDDQLTKMRNMPKKARTEGLGKGELDWQVYSAVRGLNPHCRISKDNPPFGLRALVADYDMKQSVDDVRKQLKEIGTEEFVPNFIEVSLSGKIRLVWLLERELMVNGSEGCRQFIECAFAKMNIPYLIGGYDKNSEKPAQVWTNGGEWHPVNPNPMPWKIVMGMAVHSTGKSSSFSSEVSIATISEEVKKRFPNKWQGEFELDQLGVRFWDPQADNATGCQVKPDGMLCFTGTVPFMSWAQLFGREWVDSQRIVHLGKAAGEIYFDGKRYWSKYGSTWLDKSREDAHLELRASGLSGQARKGQPLSDADRVLQFIQTTNRVDGAAPLINFAPGLVEHEGRRILNSSQIKALEPSEKKEVTPADFPWIWEFINGLLAEPNKGSVDHFLAWLQRYYGSQYHHRRDLGQALFLCGPKENGKTLLAMKIIKPLVGDRATNPYDYFTGMTQFNCDILSVPLLAMNDESAPERESVKDKLISSIKSFTVNPQHVYQPKFCNRINIPWAGRIVVTLNDDPQSIGILPEVNFNTSDKLMFFSSLPYEKQWPERDELESTIERELPFFARWLLDVYKPPTEVLIGGRMGVNSFFDSRILKLSKQQRYSHNLLEVLVEWCKTSHRFAEKRIAWSGTPTALQSELGRHEPLAQVMREWTVPKIAKALAALARNPENGVSFVETDGRSFAICSAKILSESGAA